jgi:hypothetical protein
LAGCLRSLLAQADQDERVFVPVRNLPREQLIAISQGRISQEVIDDLVTRANGGVMPDVSEAPSAGRREMIVPDHFTC